MCQVGVWGAATPHSKGSGLLTHGGELPDHSAHVVQAHPQALQPRHPVLQARADTLVSATAWSCG